MSNFFPANANLNVKADLTKPAEDITGIAKDTHKGVGKFFYALLGPWIEERIGKAKRGAAQAEKDSLDILAGHARLDEETKTMVPIGNVSNIDALCEELENVNSKCKAKRLAAALMTASIEMKQVPEEEVSDEPLNQTFFNHWRAEAELIDDEDLRQWWAHLLVEETKKPNSISPRTLDVAKKLSPYEAKLFERTLRTTVNDTIVVDGDIFPINGTYDDILTLIDAGLIGPTSTHHLAYTPIAPSIIFAGEYILAIDNSCGAISYRCHIFTKAGKELSNSIKAKLEFDSLKNVAREISKQNKNVTISIYNNIVCFSIEELLQRKPLWSTGMEVTK